MIIKNTCPFGHVCEKHKLDENGQIIETERCKLYIKMAGLNPQTGEPVDEWNCAFVWQIIMAVENSSSIKHVAAATESFRNEMVDGQNKFNNLFFAAAGQKTLTN